LTKIDNSKLSHVTVVASGVIQNLQQLNSEFILQQKESEIITFHSLDI